VTIAKLFAAGKFEVTFAQWEACILDRGCLYTPYDNGWGRGNRPVIDVSWDDAKQYVSWLSQKTGGKYRLLSEAEWEFVARAGATSPFVTGRTIATDHANLADRANGHFRGQTIEVGSFQANGFGLYDVHGNVWEWVEDCWHANYSGAPNDGSA